MLIKEENEDRALELIREAADNLQAAFVQLDNDRPSRAFAEVDAAKEVLLRLDALRIKEPLKPNAVRLYTFNLTEKQIAHLSHFLGVLSGQIAKQNGPLEGVDRVFLDMHNEIVRQINAQVTQ